MVPRQLTAAFLAVLAACRPSPDASALAATALRTQRSEITRRLANPLRTGPGPLGAVAVAVATCEATQMWRRPAVYTEIAGPLMGRRLDAEAVVAPAAARQVVVTQAASLPPKTPRAAVRLLLQLGPFPAVLSKPVSPPLPSNAEGVRARLLVLPLKTLRLSF